MKNLVVVSKKTGNKHLGLFELPEGENLMSGEYVVCMHADKQHKAVGVCVCDSFVSGDFESICAEMATLPENVGKVISHLTEVPYEWDTNLNEENS